MKIKISGETADTREPVSLNFTFEFGKFGTGTENGAVVQPNIVSVRQFLDKHNIGRIEIEDIKPIELKKLLEKLR